MYTQNRKKFLRWLAAQHPQLARRALQEVQRQAAMGAVDGFFDTLTSAVEKIAPAVVQANAQKKLLKAQMDRAKKDLPPLDASQYSPGMKVSVGADLPTWAKPVGYTVAAVLTALAAKKLLAPAPAKAA